jgi:hypothetical protein
MASRCSVRITRTCDLVGIECDLRTDAEVEDAAFCRLVEEASAGENKWELPLGSILRCLDFLSLKSERFRGAAKDTSQIDEKFDLVAVTETRFVASWEGKLARVGRMLGVENVRGCRRQGWLSEASILRSDGLPKTPRGSTLCCALPQILRCRRLGALCRMNKSAELHRAAKRLSPMTCNCQLASALVCRTRARSAFDGCHAASASFRS